MFALYAAPARQSVREDGSTGSRSSPTSTNIRVIPDRSRAARLRGQSHRQGVRPYPRRRRRRSPVEPLYSAAAARSATGLSYTMRRLPRRRTDRGEEIRAAFRLRRHRHVPVAGRTIGPGRDSSRVAELSVQALCTNRHLDRTSAGRRGRRRFPLPRRRRARAALRRRSDPTARAGADLDGGQERRAPRPATSPGASSAC